MSSSVTKTVLIIVKQQGLDQANTSINNFTKSTTAATKSTTGLGSSWDKSQGSVLKLRTGVVNLDKAEVKTTKSTSQFSKASDTAGKSTQGLAAKFQGNKGAIFAFTGMGAAGLEAVGMFSMYQSAADKLGQAQERVNLLVAAGAEGTAQHTRAVQGVTDAQRGYNFILRNVALSFGDLVPFTLLAVNAIVKMRETVAGSKGVLDAGAAATTGLGNAANTASSGGLKNMFNSLGQMVTGTKNMDTGLKTVDTTTKTFTGALTNLDTGLQTTNTRVQDATRFIGTGTNGLVGGVSGLSVEMDKTTKTSGKFTDVFKRIGTEIKNIPNLFKSAASGIASFFTNFGTNIGKFGGMLKTAGLAVVEFGKKMLMALASNPIVAAIALISGAVLALATDFGGVRTAINNFGVAIGNAIPPAKGILEAIGAAGNAALDAVAGFLGVKKEIDATGTAMAVATKQVQPLKTALEDTVKTSVQINKLRESVNLLEKGVTFATSKSIVGLEGFKTKVLDSMTTTEKKVPAVAAVLKELDATIIKTSASGYDLATAKAELNAVLTKLHVALIGTKEEVLKEGAAVIESAKASQGKITSTTGLTKSETELKTQVALLTAELKLENAAIGENEKRLAENRQTVAGYLSDVNMTTTATDAQKASLLELAPALDTVGRFLDLTGGKTANLADALVKMAAHQKEVASVGTKIWGDMWQQINKVGVQAIPIVENALIALKELHPDLAAVVQKFYDDYRENTVQVGNQLLLVNEAEKEQAKSIKSTADKVVEKAKELGILNKVQSLSLQDQQNAIKITEEQNKVENTAIMTLQKLAVARGLDISQIGIGSKKLLEHIATSKQSVATMDEVRTKTAELFTARQDEIKATELDTQAQTRLMTILKQVPPVLGMTGKGLETVSKLYDDTANAAGIAADEVGVWITTLEKEEAVQQETLKVLDLYAKAHKIEIPKAIQGDIEKTKEYIQIVGGIGPAAKKAADEAKKAFDDLVGNAASALENLIQEDVIKGDMDDIIEKIEEVGGSIDTLSAKQAIIKPFLDDEEFTNDIQGLNEILTQTWAEAELQAADGGQGIVNAFTAGIIDHLGSEAQPIVDHINQIWAQVQASNAPGTAGSTLITQLVQALNQPSLMSQAGQKLGAAVPPGFQQGTSGLPAVVNQALGAAVNTIFGAGTNFQNAGQKAGTATGTGISSGIQGSQGQVQGGLQSLLTGMEPIATSGGTQIGNEAVTGIASGIQSGASTVQNATLAGVNTPITSTVGQVPGQAATAIAPVEGVFSAAFIKASTTATGVINLMIADITKSFGFLKTNVGSILNQMAALFPPPFKTLEQTAIKSTTTASGSFSTMNKSVSSSLQQMTSKVNSFGSAAQTAFGKVKSSADQAKKSVDALQKSINALKNKTITVTVGLKGPGVPYLRHGGATINFPSESGISYAAGGKSWLQNTPKMIGGTHVAETFPEIITAIPLDPREKNSPFNVKNIDIPVPPPQMLQPIMAGGGGGAGGSGPTQVTGNIYVTVKTQNGKVLAQEVQPFLLEDFGGVT